MNTIPESTIPKENADAVADQTAEDELVEVGAVSETKGGFFGHSPDGGLGVTWP